MYIKETITDMAELISEINFALSALEKPPVDLVSEDVITRTTVDQLISKATKRLSKSGGTLNAKFATRMLELPEIDPLTAINNILFVDITDGILKYKDSSGIINPLY